MYGHLANRIVGVRHRVEGTELHREFVNNEVVSVIFRLDETTKPLFVLGADNVINNMKALR